MATEDLTNESGSETADRRIAGGAATAGGMNFQAAVTAIAGVRLAAGRPLEWLEDAVNDVPVAIWAETGGPGDDIHVELADGTRLEAQIKKGLTATKELWSALVSLAKGIQESSIRYGVLIVAPDSSETVKFELPRALRDIANETTHADNGQRTKLNQTLVDSGIVDLKMVSARIFVKVVNAIDGNEESVSNAKIILHTVCDATSVAHAWEAFYGSASKIIARKGRWDVSKIADLFRSRNIQWLQSDRTPIAIVGKLCSWVVNINSTFSVVGARQALSIDSYWLPLKLELFKARVTKDKDAASALAIYRRPAESSQLNLYDAEWIGRFIRCAVVVAGPGIGKSVLLRRVAKRYAEDGYPVLKVALASVAKRMQDGQGFEESVVSLGRDGSSIPVEYIQRAGIRHWVVLCDGLDECGAMQEKVADGIIKFSEGFPEARVIVTTRPVGYFTSRLELWRHYQLIPPSVNDGTRHLAHLLHGLLPEEDLRRESVREIADRELKRSVESTEISRSPMLLGMAASLIATGRSLTASKTALYKALLELIDGAENPKRREPVETAVVRARVLNIIAGCNIALPFISPVEIVERCGRMLAAELCISALSAKERVERCLGHWEDVGVIERLNHNGEAFVAFVHKTFAEFSAARDLLELSETEQRNRIREAIDGDGWVEVLDFAAQLGLAKAIVEALLDRSGIDALQKAIEISSENRSFIGTDVLEQLFNKIDCAFDSFSEFDLSQLGTALIDLAGAYPSAVGNFAAERLSSTAGTTRLAVLAAALASDTFTGTSEMLVDDLREALARIRRRHIGVRARVGQMMNARSFSRRLARLIGVRLSESCTPEGVRTLLEQELLWDDVVNEGLDQHMNIDLGDELSDLKELSQGGHQIARFCLSFVPPKEYQLGFLNMWRSVLRAAADPGAVDHVVHELNRPLVQVSALAKAIGLDEAPVSDHPLWVSPCDQEVIRKVVQAAIERTAINRDLLSLELPIALQQSEGSESVEKYVELLPNATVDIAGVDWSEAGGEDVSAEELVSALKFGSAWLIDAVARLYLRQGLPTRAQAFEFLSVSAGYGFIVAVDIVCLMEPGDAEALLLERGAGAEVLGFEHLYKVLLKEGPSWSLSLESCLHQGLTAKSSEVAAQAARLAEIQTTRGAPISSGMLESAFEYWTSFESTRRAGYNDSYRSPLPSLLRAISAAGPLSKDRLEELSESRNVQVSQEARRLLGHLEGNALSPHSE